MTTPFTIPLEDPNFATELANLGATGSITYAPAGTDLATLVPGMGPYKPPAVNLGWLADDGLTEAIAREKVSFIPWQVTSPIRTATTSEEFTFSATLWSLGGLANAMRYGVSAKDMKWNTEEEFVEFVQGGKLPEDFRIPLAFDVLDGAKHRRFILPAASIEDVSDITYSKSEMVGYPFTWKANLDSKLGYSVLRRFKEGWKPGTAGSLLTAGGAADLGEWHADVNAGAPAGGDVDAGE